MQLNSCCLWTLEKNESLILYYLINLIKLFLCASENGLSYWNVLRPECYFILLFLPFSFAPLKTQVRKYTLDKSLSCQIMQ